MPQGRKLALAAGLLAAGMAWALLFRRAPDALESDSDELQSAVAANDDSPHPASSPASLTDDREPIRIYRLRGSVEPDADEAFDTASEAEHPSAESTASPFESAAFGTSAGAAEESADSQRREAAPESDVNMADSPSGGWRPRRADGERMARAQKTSPSKKKPSPTPPQERKYRKYVLQDGDTLSQLADRFLGSGKRFLEIYEVNRTVLTSPDLLPVGATIRIPLEEERERASETADEPLTPVVRPDPKRPSSSAGPRSYRVREGDTLPHIARQFYGDERRWRELAAANVEKLGDGASDWEENQPLPARITLIVP